MTTTSTFEKIIRYDRTTKDYAGYLDDRLIGFFGGYHAAEVELDRVAHELLIDYVEQGLIDPPDEPSPLGDSEGDSTPRAVTAQSIAIESRVLRCVNCDKPHATWRCPEIGDRLFAPDAAPWADADLGRDLCRMKWRNFRAFVALLLSVPPAHLLSYAASYQAFIKSYRPDSDLTLNDVLRVWTKDMQRGVLAERQVAA